MDNKDLALFIKEKLEEGIKNFPAGFYDTFNYTKTGNNLTHPKTWGLLSRILWDLPGIANVGIDVRFNNKRRAKFQPDLVGYDATGDIAVCIDYESPNSSDYRIPTKDIMVYRDWCNSGQKITYPYIIITTLPEDSAEKWELRYTSASGYNHAVRGMLGLVRESPCRFWYEKYYDEFSRIDMDNIYLINISGKDVRLMWPQ